jgi:hypothetical protein
MSSMAGDDFESASMATYAPQGDALRRYVPSPVVASQAKQSSGRSRTPRLPRVNLVWVAEAAGLRRFTRSDGMTDAR